MSDTALATDAQPQRSWLSRLLALDLLDNRYPSLHGLRVIGIISVVQLHVTALLTEEGQIRFKPAFVNFSMSIFFGMDLFFILSGFLIGSILLYSLDHTGSQQLRRFYLRRILRTFPPYYVTLTFLAVVLPLTANQQRHLPVEYVYLTNFVSLDRKDVVMSWGWSLALEEQFYLTVPLLFLVLQRLRTDRARIMLLGAFCLAALVARMVIYYRWRPWDDFVLYRALYFRTYTRFDALIAGILLAFIHQRHRQTIGQWLQDPLHRAILALVSLTCLWVLMNPGMFGQQHAQFVHLFCWGTITSLMYLCALPLLLHSDGIFARFLSAPFFRKLATLGYGIYLVHIPIIDHIVAPIAKTLQDRGAPPPLMWIGGLIATFGGSVLIAYVMHILIEKPSLWLRQKIAD